MSDYPTSATPRRTMAEEHVLTRATVSRLLGDTSQENTEETQHPWARGSKLEKPLLRTWDHFSGSQPELSNCMLSRSPREDLDTSEARKGFLATHADHKIWKPTPFISFTSSTEAVQELAYYRTVYTNRGVQTITIVNPNVRFENGLPILDMSAEMSHYGILDPYERSNQYYKDHYLCLWEVTTPEIVGHWQWDDLATNDNWYEEIIMPEFERHNERLFTRPVAAEALDLAGLLNALPSTPPTSEMPRRAPPRRQEVDGPSDSESLYSTDWDTSSEESIHYCENELDWHDTDDEAEANATKSMREIGN